MHPLLENKFVKFAGIGLIGIIALFIFWGVVNLMTTSTGFDSGAIYDVPSVTYNTQSMGGSMGLNAPMNRNVSYEMVESDSMYYPPEPTHSDYTAALEAYETTAYSVTARTKEFDPLCDTLMNLKTDSQIHFKSLNESTNNCRATFFVDENMAASVLSTLTSFKGVEYNRNTSSVTRHRQQIQSQTDILKQQLASIQRSLTAAETQFDEIADIARQNKDAMALSQAINQKLNNINNLTQQKISLTSRLNQLYQQAADLEERMNVVQFDVSVYRSNPIYPNQESQKWESAWKQLKDTYTNTLIGLSAFFGIFLLEAIKYIVYLLVLIVIFRGLWKFVRLIWQKW